MVVKMKIEKYEGSFHDGVILDLAHHDNDLVITMISGQMFSDEYEENLDLDKYDCIRGKLHIKIKKILLSEEEIKSPLVMLHDDGTIIRLYFLENKITFEIAWYNYPPKERIDGAFSILDIYYESYYWENDPDLIDPSDPSNEV